MKCRIDGDYSDIVCFVEVKPKNSIRPLSSVQYYINGYNLGDIMLADEGMDIQYHLLDQFLLTNTLTQEIIICDLKTEGNNLLFVACVYRGPDLANLNIFTKNIPDEYNANKFVLVDSDYTKTDWVR